MRKTILRILQYTVLAGLMVLPVLLTTGCSYGMDALEGAITQRASFSITAVYDETNYLVDISWTKTDSSDHFAGYEVYMTEYPWDEYGRYLVVAASEPIGTTLPDIVDSFTSMGLNDQTVSIPVSPDALNDGEYYFRVALYDFDKKPKDEWADPDVPEYYSGSANYDDHTSLTAVSGFAAVEIY